jgi:cell division protein FtsZ
MLGMGYAMMGTAVGHGANAAVEAARKAISCPLLEDSRITGSRGILINITGSSQLGLHEVNEACSIIREAADCDDVQINFGVIHNESMGDAVKITVIATGFQPENAPVAERPSPNETRTVVPTSAAEPARPVAVVHESPMEPEPMVEEPPEPLEPAAVAAAAGAGALAFDPDDLDTRAYLRSGKLVN